MRLAFCGAVFLLLQLRFRNSSVDASVSKMLVDLIFVWIESESFCGPE